MPTRGRRGSKSRIASSAPKAPTLPRVATASPIPKTISAPLPTTIRHRRRKLTPGFITYSGVDCKSDSGALKLRRHDGGAEDGEIFEWEDGEQGGCGPASTRAFIDGCAGDRYAVSLRAHTCAAHLAHSNPRASGRLDSLEVWSPSLVPSLASHPSPPRGSGVWNGCDAEVGWRVVAILEGMYRSAKEGKRVHVRARKGE